jgi:hypothetical protein
VTFLQLCQYVQRYVGAGNDLPGSGNPTTTAGQTGLYLEIVGWVQDAYRDIQQEESGWLFRQASGSLTLTSNKDTYTKAWIQANAAGVALGGAAMPLYERIYPYTNGDSKFITATDVGALTLGVIVINSNTNNCYYVPFDKWSGVIAQGQAPPPQIPIPLPPYFTILPNESLALSPAPVWTGPDGPIALTFQYVQTIANLAADGDVPIWPTEWHDAIAWKAIRYWALVRESANKYAIADGEYQRVMKAMRASQLPDAPPTIEPATRETP